MDKALRYLGLAAKAGRLAVGTEDCAKALNGRKGALLIAAADAGANTLRQAETMAAEKCAFRQVGYAKQELAQAVGRAGPVALMHVADEGLARAFLSAVDEERGEQEEQI